MEAFWYDINMRFNQNKNKSTLLLIAGILLVLCFVVGVALFINSRFNIFPQLIESHASSSERAAFPTIDESVLSEGQIKVVSILKTEYALNPDGTKYSQGVSEPWCADFVSWVFNEAGTPLTNPNSGSWRIPGTYTLREYYESIGKLEFEGSGYSPKVGDIMLYDNPSPFGQHTNIVIKNENGIVTTIGGNEPGGIRIVTHDKKEANGFIGYGVF